jgi:mycothiol synthase
MTTKLRPPREEDLALVVRLLSQHSPEPIDEKTVRRSWASPGVDLELDARLEDDAYALVESLGDERVWIDFRGRATLGLLDWAEARASEKGSRLFAGAWASNEALLADLERNGFRLVRHSHRMEIDLTAPASGPVWPAGIELRSFCSGDERTLYELHQETFRDSWEPIEMPYDGWSHQLLQPSVFVPDLWFLAVAGGEAAGFAICHPHPGDPALGWVRILGVRRSVRRRGVGRALLLHAFAEFRGRGLGRAGLGVDAESPTGADRLYEQAGMHVSARFDIYEKQLT